MPPGQMGPVQLMMQHLLAERFALKVHRETKDAPGYALVHARTDRQLGKQIAPSTVDCAAFLGPDCGRPWRPAHSVWSRGPQCRLSTAGPAASWRGCLDRAAGAAALRPGAAAGDRPDRAERVFSFDLSFATDQTTDPDRPSLFTALQEQLGLKLESQRAPLEMLIVESVQQPTPD